MAVCLPGLRAPRRVETQPGAQRLRGLLTSQQLRRITPWLVLGLGALTLWILLDPRISFSYRAPEARLITETAIAFVGVGVISLSLNRFLESGRFLDGAIALAFLALAFPNIGQGVVLPASGANLFDWQDAGMYVWSVSRLVAFIVLLISAAYPQGQAIPAGKRWQWLAVGGSCVLLVCAASYAAFYVFHREMPSLLTASGRAMLASGVHVKGAFVEVTGLQVALQSTLTLFVALACLFVVAKHGRDRPQDGFHRWVGMSLIFAAFSQLHYAVYPSIYSPMITTGDVLRAAFYGLLMMALVAEFVRYQRSMRQLTILEERARIARDIHDGVAQGLSYVIGSLAQAVHEGIAPELGQRLARWREILGDAQDNLRDAITALLPSTSAEDLGAKMALFCRDFSVRYDMEVGFQCVGQPGVLLPPKDRELLFLLAEALHNVRKHSETSQAAVILEAQPGWLMLRVSDNGVGLPLPGQEAGQPADSIHCGCAAMTDRANRLGGSLVITSQAHKGTTVQFAIPK